jgi:glycosyltransferase involved in cell wall biosynthesis
VSWGPQTGDELRATYQRAWCLLHASDTGLDKVVLEAMASECLVVSTATTSQAVLPPVCQAHDALSLAESVRALQQLSPEAEHELRRHLRQTIVDRHSLNQLATRLVAEMSQTS